MKSYLFLILIVTMFFVVTKSEDEDYYTTEQPDDIITTTTENALLRTGPEEYGKRESLDPDLTGLENFGILYLPKNYNYSNIIEAYREVKQGFRYEILVNATDEKNNTIYCNMTVLEKPWFITPWDGRLRTLEKSNCSTFTEIKAINDLNQVDQALIDQSYQNNTIFNPQNTKLSKGSSLDKIEDMIVEIKIQKTNNQNIQQNSNVRNNEQFNSATIDSSSTVTAEITTTPQTEITEINNNNNNAADLSERVDDGNNNNNNNYNNNNNGEVQENYNNVKQETILQNNNADYTTTETPITPITNVQQTGNREKLQTNLVGIENMALVYLPREFTYTKVLEAYREVINGVRYDIKIQASRNDNSPIVCDIQVVEKPWLLTPWGDKVRVLERSNCSNTVDIMDINDRNHLDQATLDDKYQNNTLFNPNAQHVSDDLLDRIESMIVEPKNKKKQSSSVNNNNVNFNNRNRFETTTRWQHFQPTIETSTESFQRRINQNIEQQQQNTFNNRIQQQQQHQHTFNQQNQHPSSRQPIAGNGQLSHDDKEYLDNFFNYFNVDNNDNTATTAGQENQVFKDDKYQKNPEHQEHNHYHNLRNKRSTKKYNLKKSEHLFEKFQKKFNRNYESSFEREKRYQIFKSNLIKINQLNKKEEGTATYGLTEFADMTIAEYKMRTGLLYNPENNKINPLADIPQDELPKEFDWRTKNVITKVKDQGQCGSCWAFSVVGNIEGLHAIKTGKTEEYSEQELVDCDSTDHGCSGGMMDDAYKAIEQLGGLEYESEYPYEAAKENCKFNSSDIRVKVKGAIDFPKNETAIALWLAKNGPISIGLNANAMMFYHGGISKPWKLLCRPGGVDHAVLIVGFGVAEYPVYNKILPYWIIKNSWGKNWGEQGYYRLYRGNNACGVSEMATSAVLE